MTDPFVDVPEPSEHFLHDHLFPFFDGLAQEFDLNSDEMLADLQRVLRPSVLDEYGIWIDESWEPDESADPAVPFVQHGPEVQPAIFRANQQNGSE